MSTWGNDYGQPELVQISKEIYEYKEKKKVLELSYAEENFRYRYIPQRKENVLHQFIFNLIFIILIMGFIVSTWGGLWFFLDGFLLIIALRVMYTAIKQLASLVISADVDWMIRLVAQHNWNSFQKQESDCLKRLSFIKLQIEDCDREITNLEFKRKEMLKKKEQREDSLRKKGILFDENPNASKSQFSLKLEQDSVGMQEDAVILHELYSKEAEALKKYIDGLQVKLNHLDKQIIEIDENFEETMKQIVVALIIFVMLILIENQMTGVASIIIGLIFVFVSLGYMFYMEKKIKSSVVLYLIEHENKLTSDYAFRNNIIPVKYKRAELMEKIESNNKELQDILTKRDSLEI